MLERSFSIQFPEDSKKLNQDEEYFIYRNNGKQKRLLCHDYDKIYSIPGLYEHLFYDKLKCTSPETICTLLKNEIEKSPKDISDLNVFDIGAGNGMVGEQLSDIGVKAVVGLDIIEEAAQATNRDRPGVYDDYYVNDLINLPDKVNKELKEKNFNCLITVATLGFGDIPPLAFAEAYNLISMSGWVAFNIKEDFLANTDSSGFSKLIKEISSSGVMQIRSQQKYRHRLSLNGDPLYYVAIVGKKIKNISTESLI